ncbi:hypothetical protein [Sporomusa sp.]|uniref:hypothetical protein n=1 Tax=Sporomusa sp. TaxID=2078658 RepID=UPI002C66B2EE|nr:hypothetical protein [Sporomusa sp.]HWR08759.1 hypothetical protein [Sporomusa sp.]
MTKIKKNLSDSEMFKGWHEQLTFETAINDEQPAPPVVRATKKDPAAEDINSAFLTPELKESIGKALLELKLNLYKEGIVDYQVKVSCQGHQVLLTAVAPKAKLSSNQPVQQSGRRKG